LTEATAQFAPQRKVYLPNAGGHDYSDAERFGTLVPMSKGEIDKFNTTQMIRVFQAAMAESDEGDFILQAGPAVMLALACAVFASKHHRVNLLIWRYGEKPEEDQYTHHRLVL